MQPDSTPLISANVLRAASAGTAQARQTDASSRTLEAEVTAVRPTRDGWNLTLRSAGQEFQVKSEYPLPRETRVQLALTEGKAGVELQVKSITLPSGANTGGSLHNEANAALLRPLLQQFLASRVPLLPATTNTATAGAAEIGACVLGFASPARTRRFFGKLCRELVPERAVSNYYYQL